MKYIIFLVFGLRLQVHAQDPVFTTTRQSLIHLNPSFSGSNGGIRYQGIYRDQWYALSGNYKTFYNSFDAYIKPIRGGIALSYMRDDQARGTLITDRIDLSYAQHLNFFKQKLKIIPSLQFSYFRKTLDNSKLYYGDMIDPRRGFSWSQVPPNSGYSTHSNVDLSAGLVTNYKNFYIGASLFHIFRPDEGIRSPSKLPARLSLFTSYNLFIGDKVLLNAMYRFENQQNFYYHNFNVNALLFRHLIVATGIASHAAHLGFGYRHDYFTLSGDYILTTRTFGGAVGSYELAASFNLRNKDKRTSITDFERW